MSTLKVNNIQNANGTSAIAIDSSGVATFSKTLVPSSSMMYRNLIINGDMRIAQRGTSVSGLSSGSGYQTVDRFQFDTDGTIGTWTMSQDTDVPTGQGFSNSVKYTCTASATISSNAQLRMNHYIEAQNLQHLKYGTANAESITLSFWVKSNKTGTFAIWTYALDGTRVISNLVTISSADTWEKKTITIAGDTSGTINNDNGAGLLIVFQFVAGTNLTSGTLASSWESLVAANLAAGQTINLADSTSNYINITGVQLEVGDAATPFEHRPFDAELARCKRYYEKSYPIGTFAGSTVVAGRRQMGGSNAGATTSFLSGPAITFEVEKRTTPTIVLYDSAGNSGKCVRYQLSLADSQNENITAVDIGSTGLYTYSPNGTSRTGVAVHFTADSEL